MTNTLTTVPCPLLVKCMYESPKFYENQNWLSLLFVIRNVKKGNGFFFLKKKKEREKSAHRSTVLHNFDFVSCNSFCLCPLCADKHWLLQYFYRQMLKVKWQWVVLCWNRWRILKKKLASLVVYVERGIDTSHRRYRLTVKIIRNNCCNYPKIWTL